MSCRDNDSAMGGEALPISTVGGRVPTPGQRADQERGCGMSEDDGARSRREALYNLDRILDVHTHLTGMEG